MELLPALNCRDVYDVALMMPFWCSGGSGLHAKKSALESIAVTSTKVGRVLGTVREHNQFKTSTRLDIVTY